MQILCGVSKVLKHVKARPIGFGPKAIIRPTEYFRYFVASVRSHRLLITQRLMLHVFSLHVHTCVHTYIQFMKKKSNSDLINRNSD